MNTSPADIESALKSACPLIGQAACIGDACPFNVALLVLDAEATRAWAARHGLSETSVPALAEHPRVRAAVRVAVQIANERLSRAERIKRWVLLSDEAEKLAPRPIPTVVSDPGEAVVRTPG